MWAQYVRDYGYPILVLWCFMGAEEGVFAASHGLLNPLGVVVASATGGALGGQVYFYLA